LAPLISQGSQRVLLRKQALRPGHNDAMPALTQRDVLRKRIQMPKPIRKR
jgi:hypothetical protein